MKIGKYTLIKKLATGGMAEIFLAQQEGPAGFQKTVVIKRILPHLAEDERFVTMFLNEARLAALLNHPNVVSIYDLGEDRGSYYLAMEYIHGRSLDQILARAEHAGQPVPLEICARIIADACTGLDYAHKFASLDGTPLNLVHRDVSPQNILVTFGGLVKVVDFGVAKAATNVGKTQTGAVKGKYAYMSPEQIAGQHLDGRSDVFALGVVLFELATGRRPFGDQSDLLAVTAILNEAPQIPRQLRPDFPTTLEEILFKSLEKDKTRRYQDAHLLQVDLERFIRAQGKIVSAQEVAGFLGELYGDTAHENLALRAAELTPIRDEDPTDIAVTKAVVLRAEPAAPSPAPATAASATSAASGAAMAAAVAPTLAVSTPAPAVDAEGLPLLFGPSPPAEGVPAPAADEGDRPTVRLGSTAGVVAWEREEPAPARRRSPLLIVGLVLGLLFLFGLVGAGGLYFWLIAAPAPDAQSGNLVPPASVPVATPAPATSVPASPASRPPVGAATLSPSVEPPRPVPLPLPPPATAQGAGASAGVATVPSKPTPPPPPPPPVSRPEGEGDGGAGPPKPRPTGTVLIQAPSKADVYVDGKLVGRMPLPDLPLAVGRHEIKAVWGDGSRDPVVQTVLVTKDGVINVSLFP